MTELVAAFVVGAAFGALLAISLTWDHIFNLGVKWGTDNAIRKGWLHE